ncbi:hypothetical protein TeGR_g7954, partial [Tetraparma gracilis]
MGGTGLAGRHLFSLLSPHPLFLVTHVLGSPLSKGRPYREVWEEKERFLRKHYAPIPVPPLPYPPSAAPLLVTCASSLPPTTRYVFSCVAPSLGSLETELAARGHRVVSISPHGRAARNTVVPALNARALLPALLREPAAIIKSPNCAACGLAPVLLGLAGLAPLGRVVVTTMQSLSGRGDAV